MKPHRLLWVFLTAASVVTARADQPPIDGSECTVTPADAMNGVVVCPEAPDPVAASSIHITVRYQGAPIANAGVVVTFATGIEVCPGAVLTATTDAHGECDITLSASGCLDTAMSSAVIRVNGVVIRDYRNVKSPDRAAGQSNGRVDLVDLVAFSQEFNGQSPVGCHDYTNDELVNLSDLMIFGEAFLQASRCP